MYSMGLDLVKIFSTAGIDLVEIIIGAIVKGENTVGIFLDLSKAFESVSHSIFLSTLQRLGIVGNSLKWFLSFILITAGNDNDRNSSS